MTTNKRQPPPPLQPVAVIGMAGSGKTELCKRLTQGLNYQFSDKYKPTVGVDSTFVETIDSNNKPIKYQMFDFTGAPSFQDMVEIELRRTVFRARPIIMALDPKENLEEQIEYYRQMKEVAPKETQFIFVVTKSDLLEKAEENHCKFTLEQVNNHGILKGETILSFSAKDDKPANAALFQKIDEAAIKTMKVINDGAKAKEEKGPKKFTLTNALKTQVQKRVLDKFYIELIRMINKYANPKPKLGTKLIDYNKLTDFKTGIQDITDINAKKRAEKLLVVLEKGSELVGPNKEYKDYEDFKNQLKNIITTEQKSFDKYNEKNKPKWYSLKSSRGNTQKISENALKGINKLKP